ncbi:hypothetical protein D3C80_1983290 [compost metagenome]
MKLIQRRNCARRGSSRAGESRARGWESASQIRMAALSVITSPPGVTRAGTWRMGLTCATLSRSASPSQVGASMT